MINDFYNKENSEKKIKSLQIELHKLNNVLHKTQYTTAIIYEKVKENTNNEKENYTKLEFLEFLVLFNIFLTSYVLLDLSYIKRYKKIA